jgi:hypothetical protein
VATRAALPAPAIDKSDLFHDEPLRDQLNGVSARLLKVCKVSCTLACG